MLSVDFLWCDDTGTACRSTVALLVEDVLSNFWKEQKEGRNDEWMGWDGWVDKSLLSLEKSSCQVELNLDSSLQKATNEARIGTPRGLRAPHRRHKICSF